MSKKPGVLLVQITLDTGFFGEDESTPIYLPFDFLYPIKTG